MKKGRHRRFEEARALKRSTEVIAEPCPECGADPEDDHASWCLFEEEQDEDGIEAAFENLRSAPNGRVGEEGVAPSAPVEVGREPVEHRPPDQTD